MGEGSSYLSISNCELNLRADGTNSRSKRKKESFDGFVRFLTDHALFIGFSYRPYRVKICITCDSWSQYRH